MMTIWDGRWYTSKKPGRGNVAKELETSSFGHRNSWSSYRYRYCFHVYELVSPGCGSMALVSVSIQYCDIRKRCETRTLSLAQYQGLSVEVVGC
jgi:hypothetical protein